MNVSPEFDKNGGSYLISQSAADLHIYNPNKELIGRPDGQFMIPSNQMDQLLVKHPNDPRAWEKQLGLNPNSLGEHPLRVDVYSPQQYNLREPTADLSGSNDKFVPDGKTAGGYDEAIINQFPNPTIPGNESVGRVTPVEMNISEKQGASTAIETMPPDRRADWPSNSTNKEMCGASLQDIPPISSPKTAEQSAAGPQNPSQITPVKDSTILKNLSGNKESGINPGNEAVSAAAKAAGGMHNG